jgi:hypothetical protein
VSTAKAFETRDQRLYRKSVLPCPACRAETLHDSIHDAETYKRYHPLGGYTWAKGNGTITHDQFLEKLAEVETTHAQSLSEPRS